MKKLICLTVLVLATIVFESCTTTTSNLTERMLKPGDNIGKMTIEEHAMSTKYPDIWEYCPRQPEEMEPGTQTIDCDVPLISKLQFDIGWAAKDAATLDANWGAMAWELYIDGYQINLDEFGQWHEGGRPDLGVYENARGWVFDLNNLAPGKHTLHYFWKSEIAINDGFAIYAPGTYEYIVNFTVSDK